jgi:hypothetical protein
MNWIHWFQLYIIIIEYGINTSQPTNRRFHLKSASSDIDFDVKGLTERFIIFLSD